MSTLRWCTEKIPNFKVNWNHCKFRLCVTLSFFASKILCNDKLIMLREIWFIKVVGSWPINRSFYRFITFESCYCLGAAVCRLLTFHVSVVTLKRLLQTAKYLFLVKNVSRTYFALIITFPSRLKMVSFIDNSATNINRVTRSVKKSVECFWHIYWQC